MMATQKTFKTNKEIICLNKHLVSIEKKRVLKSKMAYKVLVEVSQEKLAHKKTKAEMTQLKLGLAYLKKVAKERELGLLSKEILQRLKS